MKDIFSRCTRAGRRPPLHVLLLHRSRQCNKPEIVLKLFESEQRLAGRVTLAHQERRTDWLRSADILPTVGEQLTLAWGATAR